MVAAEEGIGLDELITVVKRELLNIETGEDGAPPLFSVDQVSLELQVTVRREGKGGLKIYVLELGGGASRDDAQKVTVSLSPILSKDERVQLYKSRFPDHWRKLEDAAVAGTLKGKSGEPLGNVFGG